MKKIFSFLLFMILISNCFSQGINNLWLIGAQSWAGPPYGGGINMDFSGGNLNIGYMARNINFNCTNAEICNASGNLLFCSNGIYVANANNDTMLNGNGLNPAFFTTLKDSLGLTIPQANLIIPFPDDSTKYYLFHETCDDYGVTYCTFYLYYSIIDMTLDSGRGAVIQKNIILLSDSLVEGRLTACKHANGRDWWLTSHQYNTNRYYKYLITPFGIQGPFIQNIGAVRGVWGQSVFSPDGNRFAYYDASVGDLDIFDFDRCTGGFSNLIHLDINDSATAGGVAFSSNSNVLYVSSTRYVYQFDMSGANVLASQMIIAVYDGFSSPYPPFSTTFYLSQLAPDGKIYINCGNSTLDIHVINSPDSVGLSCNVCQHCIHLPAINHFTIANHPNYFLGAESGSICDSLMGVQSFSVQSSKLNIFPNPVSSNQEITFTYPSTGEHSFISIINLEGKEVVRYQLPQWSSVQHLKLPKLSGGLYLARLVGNRTSGSVKFIVE
jgi:hypothetical protein